MAPLFPSSHCDGQKVRCNWECGGGDVKGVALQAREEVVGQQGKKQLQSYRD